ncbi:unnamed protein product [Durusdinium trenchii]|uniref:Uncharacterized protein n=1 Tax=Durusdinium trenchii TaxID=1381693 RepID=A0ABP0I891_9DINO
MKASIVLALAVAQDCGLEQCPSGAILTCGIWCQQALSEDCLMNATLMPCQGSYCKTTCQRWYRSMTADLRTIRVTCQEFADFAFFSKGAAVCAEECLLPEIRAERYPSPTGYGLLCRPGSCDASSQARYAQDPVAIEKGLAALECPCNWFGSDCKDDWVQVRHVRKQWLGDFQLTFFSVDKGDWKKIMKDYRPGSILRVQHLDQNGIPREQPYALAGKDEEGILKVLTGPPPEGLHEVVVEVAHAVRQHTPGPCTTLFVNPAIAGFFNGRYEYLLDALGSVKQVAIVSSGVGFSGVKAAISGLLPTGLQMHIFYGVRNAKDVPYQDFLTSPLVEEKVKLTLLVSGQGPTSAAGNLQNAVDRGQMLLAAKASSAVPIALQPHDVPQDCIGYVTGNRRAALGGIEEEWGTLMFFMNKDGQSKGTSRGRGGSEQLAIFGNQRARRGAELKVMSAVETKAPGTFTRGVREKFSDEKGFATDRMIFRDDELSYALGRERRRSTRKKLALAGHGDQGGKDCCHDAAGFQMPLDSGVKERKRVKQFIDWLLAQRAHLTFVAVFGALFKFDFPVAACCLWLVAAGWAVDLASDMGENYEVWGQFKWGPGGQCPEGLAGKTVALKCEGDVFNISGAGAWLSSRLRSQLLEKGCEEAIEIPMKKATAAKIVEYLKHHEEHECSEILTPLAGDNLQDCGASRWDSSFVNVDRELLFDLTVAASYLDIASLWLLLSAKAALMTNNKSAEKLRKEFSMLSDFPAGEEAKLRQDYAASRKNHGHAPDPDLSQLAATSVVRSGVRASEYKVGIKQLTDGSEDASAHLRSWRHAMWRAAVLDDWNLLANAPEQVKGDRDLVKSAILTSQGAALKYISSDLKADQTIVLDAIKYSGKVFADAAPDLRNDKDFLLKALSVHGGAMCGAPDSMRSDKAFLLEAAKAGKGAAMQGASLALREDRNFVLEMAVHDAEAYRYASEDLLNDKDFAVAVAKRNGKALKFMLSIFKADPDVVRAAISRDPQAAQFAHASRRAELGIIQESIHGEVQLKEELQSQLKAAQDEAASVTTLAVAGPRQIPVQALPSRQQYTSLRLQKCVYFTAASTMTANIGQANYVASNAYMDRLPQFQRPEVDAVGLMWGAVGGIGMRWKAFASEDFLNDVPDALMNIQECGKVLYCASILQNPPEWFCAQKFAEDVRKGYLTPTAGVIKLEQEVVSAAAEQKLPDEMALQGLPDVDRRPIPGNFADAPLGGWPSLLSEGAKVRLTGTRAKNGITGTLLHRFEDGKWKVQLDDGSGSALLRPNHFEILEHLQAPVHPKTHRHNTPELEAFNTQVAAERQWKIEEKRAKLKEKIAAKRQAILSAAAA